MNRSSVLHFLPPGVVDKRGDRTMLVWGELGRWLVVDDELHALLSHFDGRRPVKQVIRQHAKKWQRREGEVEAEALALLADLTIKGILRPDGKPVKLRVEPIRIANLTLNITNRCNLACPFCYNDSSRAGEADADALMKAICSDRELFTQQASFIVLGGEPLLELERLLCVLDSAAAFFETPVLVSTNGTLLKQDAVDQLARRNVEIQVSIDAPTAAAHDAGRGAGTFDRAMAGVDRLVAAGVHTILSMVYTADNLEQMEPYLEMARTHGAAEARFIPLRAIGGGLKWRESVPDQRLAFDHLMGVLERRPELRYLLGRDYFSIAMTMARLTMERSGCGVGRQVLFVDADGTVYPCPNHVYPELAVGNVLHEELRALLHDSPVMGEMRRRYRIDRYKACRECPFRSWCAGDCRGETLAVTGDPAAPSPHCVALRSLFLESLWLLADGDRRLGAIAKGPPITC